MSVVLVLQARGLGELLAAVPALRALRRAYPRHRIVLAAPARLEQVVDLTGAVDELVPTADPAALLWDRTSPELAVNLHGNDVASARALADTQPGRVIGFRTKGWPKPSGPRWDPECHIVDRWCGLLEAEGIAADRRNLGLVPPVASISRRDCVVVHIGAGAPARRWPAERFAAVIRHLLVLDRSVVVTGDAFERDIAMQVAKQAGLPDDRVLAGRQTLSDLAATVAEAALVISGDTGVAHLATAFGTRTVLLFGPTPPRLGGPPTHLLGRHAVLWTGQTGDPDGLTPDEGLLRIGAREVIAATDAQLSKHEGAESTRSRYRRVG
ncbi:glycosyltransferase family 9 protein [Nocardia camponoti]|uniref:glycosyltransferase family 9 protein n=1 Tax=Nocardia camponoti TaxID=1616106 RepID=UPI0016663254|nr:glycosyltransferase family 9 protein [Nocardia camponoti]